MIFQGIVVIELIEKVKAQACDNKNYLSNSNGYCWQCDSKCEQWKGSFCSGSRFSCSSCQNTLFQRNDDFSCTDQTELYGFYSNASNRMLIKCDQRKHCMTCLNSSQFCTACFPGYYLIASIQQIQENLNTQHLFMNRSCGRCGDKYFIDKGNSCTSNIKIFNYVHNLIAIVFLQECADRIINCTNCLNDNSCTSCNHSLPLLFNQTASSFSCSSQSNLVGYFQFAIQSTQSMLQKCDNECFSCLGTSHDCTQCNTSYLSSKEDQPFFCIQSCNIGYYYNASTKICQQCSLNCLQCDQSNNCLLCKQNTYKYQKSITSLIECTSLCMKNYYPNQVTLQCEKCHFNCQECFGPSLHDCFQCKISQKYSFHLIGISTCIQQSCGDGILSFDVEQCDDGNTNNNDGCNSQCQIEQGWECTPNQKDTSINQQIFNSFSKCHTICGDGLQIDYSYGGQEQCDENEYFGCDAQTCKIRTGYYCFGGSPNSSDTCFFLCDENCINCVTDYNSNDNIGDNLAKIGQCQKCSQDYFSFQDKCLKNCPQGLFKNNLNNECVSSCPQDMLVEKNECIDQCSQGYILQYKNCVLECEENYYYDFKQSECIQCHFSCSKCKGKKEIDCIECIKGYLLVNNSICLIRCISGYKYEIFLKQCQICFFGCDSCVAEYYLFNDDCVEICPSGTFANSILKTCDIFYNPIILFQFSYEFSNNIISINQDLIIKCNIQSIYPVISMNWTLINQSTNLLSNQKFENNTITLKKQNLDYNNKITIKFSVTTIKETSSKYINLSTYSKPTIQLQLFVNNKQSKLINHMKDVFNIRTTNWPSIKNNCTLYYQIKCIGMQSGNEFNIVEKGESQENININYVFPYVDLSENYEIKLHLFNNNLDFIISDTIRLVANQYVNIQMTAQQLLGSIFDLSYLNYNQINILLITINTLYRSKFESNHNFFFYLMDSINSQQKFGLEQQCHMNSICSISSICVKQSNHIKCQCNDGYSGTFCTFTLQEQIQLQSFYSTFELYLSNSNKNETSNIINLTIQQFLQIGLNITFYPEIRQGLINVIGKKINYYIKQINQTNQINYYFNDFVILIGQIIDKYLLILNDGKLNSQTQQFYSQMFDNLNQLVTLRLSKLNSQINPSVSIKYSNSLHLYLTLIDLQNHKTMQQLKLSSEWFSDHEDDENREKKQQERENFRIKSMLQLEPIECQILIPGTLFFKKSSQILTFDIRKWRFNPIIFDNEDSSILITELESDFVEINSSLDITQINQDNLVTIRLPRITNTSNDDITNTYQNIKQNYQCLFNKNDQTDNNKWDNTTCIVSQVSQYHIDCSCLSLQGIFVTKRQFQLFSSEEIQMYNFLIKLTHNSGMWMSLSIIILFFFCWIINTDKSNKIKDTKSSTKLKKKSFRRLILILSVLFVHYEMKPIKFRLHQLILSITNLIFISSTYYLIKDSININSDSIIITIIISISLSFPLNYQIGIFSSYAQFSGSEYEMLIELSIIKSSVQSPVAITVEIAQNKEQADKILKEYEQKQQQKQQSQSNKYINFRSCQSLTNNFKERIFVLYPNFIKKRVYYFQIVCLIIELAQVIMISIQIGLIEHSRTIFYFILSSILVILIDIIILDFAVALGAQYYKLIFKLIKKKGVWFQLPEDYASLSQDQLLENQIDKLSSNIDSQQYQNSL